MGVVVANRNPLHLLAHTYAVWNVDPFPWQSMAVWMLTQMKRWGYVKGEVNYKQVAEKVFLLTDAKKHMAQVGFKPPEGAYPKFKVMGKEFDPAKPDEYVKSFAISRSAA